MQRLFVSGFSRELPNGAREIYEKGVYNVRDELADTMVAAGVAFYVDKNDIPLGDVENKAPIARPVKEMLAAKAAERELPDLEIDHDDETPILTEED